MPEWMNQKFHRYLADQRKGKLSGDHRMACDLPEMAVRKQQVQSEAVSTHNREFLHSTQLFNVENKIIP